MACIGLASGYGFSVMALTAGAIVLIVLKLLQRIVEVHFIHRTETLAFLNEYFTNMSVKILDVDFHAENKPDGNLYANLYTLSMPNRTHYVDIIATLSEHKNIRAVRTRNI